MKIHSFDDLFSGSEDIVTKDVSEYISFRLRTVSEMCRQAMREKGFTFQYLGDVCGVSASSILRSMSNTFSMDFSYVTDFLNLLFPGKMLDEILWGEKIPMLLPNVDKLFLSVYHDQIAPYKVLEQQVLQYMERFQNCNLTYEDKLRDLQKDRVNVFPILEDAPKYLFYTAPSLQKVTFLKYLENENGHSLGRLMKYSMWMGVSTDYLLNCDYSGANLYVEEARQKIQVSDADKLILKKISCCALEDKMKIIEYSA